MEKFDDRLDGFSSTEYEALAQAYKTSKDESLNGVLIENAQFMDARENSVQPFNEDNFIYSGVNAQAQNAKIASTVAENENKASIPFNDDVVAPTPQVSYVGLNETERRWLNDLIQDLRQYYNNDYGLSEFLGQETQEVERPLLYFVSKNKILSKIVNLLCSIFDKSKLNKELNNLVLSLISLSKVVNSK